MSKIDHGQRNRSAPATPPNAARVVALTRMLVEQQRAEGSAAWVAEDLASDERSTGVFD